jgi:Peptidase S46
MFVVNSQIIITMPMKKSLLLLNILAAMSTAASANEGMWMPQQLPAIAGQLKSAGLKLNPTSLSKLTEFPMGALVGLGNCSASFVSAQGLIVTNHHCAYEAIAYNSTSDHNYLENGFLAKNFGEELRADPGKRITVTNDVQNVTKKIISPAVAKLNGKARLDGIENNRKALIAECEKEAGYRCTVAAFYSGLEFYLIKDLEVRDVRLVYAPAKGVGLFGGDTDNWVWPRHTGDYSYFRAYVGKDGKPAEYSKDNVPLVPKHFLKLAKEGLKEGDFVMAAGYPGRTNRYRLPSEVEANFNYRIPGFLKSTSQLLNIIERETQGDENLALKYADMVAGVNNAQKSQQGMQASYNLSGADFLDRKQKQHAELKAWVNADPQRKNEYAQGIEEVERLIAQRNDFERVMFLRRQITPALAPLASQMLRFANEQAKPNEARKIGFQTRDLGRIRARIDGFDRQYDPKVDQAIVLSFLKEYLSHSGKDRDAAFDAAVGLRDNMDEAELKTVLQNLYAGTQLADKEQRLAWLKRSPAEFEASKDSMIKIAVAKYAADLNREAEREQLEGEIQASYSVYMKAKLAFMKSKNLAVYPDANGSLRVTFGKVASRPNAVDGSNWTAFTTLQGIVDKHTGKGEFNAPKAQLAAIKSREFGKYADPKLNSVPVNFLATLDITGGASGSPVLNAKAELVGLAFDGTFDTIISDWDFNATKTRSINLDARYMLWQMKYIDKADNLLKEMNVN